ncbi:hypothetical protein [Bartonella sp. CB178]|uniref:hypothetical protein n=1 Tax=Bartonella sp. CB178 TaxID=3112255 RepID=UPI00300DD62F
MKNVPFVKEDETVVILCEDETGDAYEGPIEQVEEVLELVDERETVQRILRLDLVTLRADDVSEEVADVYVQNNDIEENDEKLQPFILNSDAYQLYLDEKIAQDYEKNVYGSYEKQNRLRPRDVLNGYWW